jgi:hypothetical protein
MSNKPKVEIHYNGAEDGDWVVIKLDGEIYASGHTFTLHDLRDLLVNKLGLDVTYNDDHTNDSIMDLTC